MKRRGGKTYRKFKGQMGRVYWVEMRPDEVTEAQLFRTVVCMAPLIMITVFAWAAGLI